MNSGGGGATGDGGGGQGIRCGSSKNSQIENRIFVRDVYEAVFNHQRKMKTIKSSQGDGLDPEAIRALVSSLEHYFGPSSGTLEITKEKFWENFVSQISFLDDSRVLRPSEDANSPIALPSECKIVQIAYWEESSGRSEKGILYVNRKHWSDLDQLNRVALLAHEYFFSEARKAGYKNSDSTRKKVGQLLSVEGLDPLLKFWKPSRIKGAERYLPDDLRGFKFCKGTSVEDPQAVLQMYQYHGVNGKQHIVFPYISSSFINIDVLQAQNYSFDLSNEAISSVTNFFLFQSYLKDMEKYAIQNHELEVLRRVGSAGIEISDSPEKYFELYISKMRELSSVVWTDTIFSSSIPISVSFLNPAFDTRVAKSDLASSPSREDLIQGTLQLAEKLLENKDKAKVIQAIAILNKEVKDQVERGSFNEEFPEWVKALDAVGTPSGQPLKPSFRDSNELQGMVPMMLYSLYLNNYNKEDITKLLELGLFSLNEHEPMPLGRLQLKQNDKAITFDLQCEGYADRIASIGISSMGQSPDFANNKIVTVSEVNLTPGVERISNFLKSESEKLFGKYNIIKSPHFGFFKDDLRSSAEVKLSKCENPIKKYFSKTECVIATLSQSGNSYILYFDYSKDDKLKHGIEFVQIVAPSLDPNVTN